MKVILLLSFFIFAGPKKLPPKPAKEMPPLSEAQFERVDPHGKETDLKDRKLIDQNKECLVCHTSGSKKEMTNAALETCFNCHNKSPHSGIAEHTVQKITCISCHTFHRWDSKGIQKNSGLFQQMKSVKSTDGYVLRSGSGLMIKKDCRDCHQWK